MKEYDVKIKETLELTITTKAESQTEAEDKIREAYFNGEYILDSDNFSEVDFRTTDEREIVQEQPGLMEVLLIKPGMYPQQVKIGCELEDLQKAVGGDIQAIYPYDEPVALVMDEEGKINGSELNRALRDETNEVYDIIAGNFLVVGLGEENFEGLTHDLMKQFEEKFHQPEMFVKMGKSLMVLPVPDEKVKKTDTPEKLESKPQKLSLDRDSL